MSWPGTDPFYSYNSADGDARRSYYGLNWVPYMVIDGENDESNVTGWQNHILANAATDAPVELMLSGAFDYQSGDGTVAVTINTEPIFPSGSYKLHVVLVEDDLYYMGSNGHPDHEAVMRDMFPSSSGLALTIGPSENLMEEVNFHVPSELVLENSRLVVFLQASNHDIMNATTEYVTNIAPVNIPNLTVMETELEILDDDGDSKLNPGETANLLIAVENACDWVDAENVTASLTSSSPWVTMVDDSAFYDLIIACDFIVNTDDALQFTVSEDAPPVADLEFTLRLIANLDSENPYIIAIPLVVSMDFFQVNFPVDISQPIIGGNAVIDLDQDGAREIVVTGTDSLLHVFTLDGDELSGFPYASTNKLQGAPAIADLDMDGDLEVVTVDRDGQILVIHHDGTGEPIANAISYILATPALSDLDGDGDLEIVVGGFGYDLLAVHHDGTPLEGFPKLLPGERMTTGAILADLNGDEIDEIMIGTWGDRLHVFDAAGNELEGFPVDFTDDVKGAPAAADLDGDDHLEILVGLDDGDFVVLSELGEVLWINSTTSTSIKTSPAVVDFEGDGYKEIVYAATDGVINVVNYMGENVTGWPQDMESGCESSPVIADLDGDGTPEIIVGSNGGMVHAYDAGGNPVENFPIAVSGEAKGTPTVEDFDEDGNLEIVIGTSEVLAVVDVKSEAAIFEMWNTSRGGYLRNGAYLYGYNPSSIDDRIAPESFTLEQNYPNPFNPTTNIRFGIPEAGEVRLLIFDIQGREVADFGSEYLNAGWYETLWNGQADDGNPAATGIYFARLESAGDVQIIKMTLVK